MSSSPKAKFAPRSSRRPNAAERHAFTFADEVRELAVGIVDAAIAKAVFEDSTDPKLYGLALLCRSISNFQDALTMARVSTKRWVRTLVRSVSRTCFWSTNFDDTGRDL